MRITTALKNRDGAKHALRDLFSSARHFGLSHAVMLERRQAIYDRHHVAKAPAWSRAYLAGVWDQLQEQAYRDALVYGGTLGGRFYSTHRDRPDYYEKHGIAPRDYADDGTVRDKGHYWGESLKPFFISEA